MKIGDGALDLFYCIRLTETTVLKRMGIDNNIHTYYNAIFNKKRAFNERRTKFKYEIIV